MSKMSGSTVSYSIGFLLSLLLTFAPYLLVTKRHADYWFIAPLLAVFAIAQLLVQLLFFLHLGREKGPRWHSLAFGFAVMVVAILAFGSLWIMNNLNYRTMTPDDTTQYIQQEEGITR